MTALPALTADFAPTRDALHALAEQVISPARKRTVGRGFLVCLPGGFGAPEGTPRVQGVELVAREDLRSPITSLSAAAELLELPRQALSSEALAIEPDSAAALATFYAFAQRVLEALHAEVSDGQDPSAITLWPEHFDLAFEFGVEAAGTRAGYGASPGDEAHSQPYLYVGPWREPEAGPLWQASGFNGAELLYSDLGEDPHDAALAFFRSRRDALQP